MRNLFFTSVLFVLFFATNSVLSAAGQEVGSGTFSGDLTQAGFAFPVIVTCYAPGPNDKIEGPWATSLPNVSDGSSTPMTLDCVYEKKCKYVTLASNPDNYRKFFFIGDFTYNSVKYRRQITLHNLVGYVNDTGGDFKIDKRKMDVALGDFRGWSGSSASNFVDSQRPCQKVSTSWRQLTGAPPNLNTTSSVGPQGPMDYLNQATGGALGRSPIGQFLGLQPSNASQPYYTGSRQPVNGVTGGAAGTPSYASTTPTTSATPSSVLSRSTPTTSTTTNAANSDIPVLPLTDAVLAQTQAEQNIINTTNPNAPLQSIKNAPPTLLCVPGVVEPNEQALLFWSCNDASTTARVTADTNEQCETSDKTSGVMCAHPAATTTYTLNCNRGTTAQCLIEVINPTLAIITTPRSVVRGGTVDISWQSDDTQDCVLKSDTQPTFNRRGVSGDVVSHTLSQDTTFTLLCETRTGSIREKEITVDVI